MRHYTISDDTTDTHLFPEELSNGHWRLQSTDPAVKRLMRKRCRDKKWMQVGFGCGRHGIDIFRTTFENRRKANEAFLLIVASAPQYACKLDDVQPKRKRHRGREYYSWHVYPHATDGVFRG